MPPSSTPRASLFRGSEWARLVTMAAFAVVCVGLLYSAYLRDPKGAAAPPPVDRGDDRPTAGSPPPPPPLDGPEFQGLTDRTALNRRENPAYKILADRARDDDPADLRRRARRDVVFSQLYGNPARYRGVPIHLEATARRILRQEVPGSKIFPSGTFYEIYATTTDGGPFPWTLVAETVPAELPVGDSLAVPILFDGYFLKIFAYKSAEPNVPGRTGPLLVGRVELPEGGEAVLMAPIPSPRLSPSVWGWVLGGFAALIALRWAFLLRSYLARPSTRVRPARGRPTSSAPELPPGALDAWVETQAKSADIEADTD